jgi:hypothetical protein
MLGLPADTGHLPCGLADEAPEDPGAYVGSYTSAEFMPLQFITVSIDENGKLCATTQEGEREMVFCHTTRFILGDGKKPLDQCRAIRFLVRDGKAWAVQEVKDGFRVLRRTQ